MILLNQFSKLDILFKQHIWNLTSLFIAVKAAWSRATPACDWIMKEPLKPGRVHFSSEPKWVNVLDSASFYERALNDSYY